jgi:two-component system LytT family response regulator
MRAIIVDDEVKARRVLLSLLEEHCPALQVVDQAGSVPEALRCIHTHQPDLVFLDIEMPGYTGFQLLELLPEANFQVIFTTAYSEYALQAFEVSAIDYLLKPIRIQKLIAAVEKASRMLEQQEVNKLTIQTLKSNLQQQQVTRMAIPVNDGLIFTDIGDIMMLVADGAYTHIYLKTNPKPLLISKPIKEFEQALEQHPDFFRSHRSFLVNLQFVTKYQKSDGGSILIHGQYEALLAKDRKEAFLERVAGFRI